MSGAQTGKPNQRERLLGGIARRPPSPGAMRRRRWMVGLSKRTLPLAALGLLALIATWPELSQQADRARMAYRRGLPIPESGMLTSPRYRGEDQAGRTYTLTAASARQNGAERIALNAPVGDVMLGGGSWAQAEARQGVYMQKAGQLDLSGEVTLYRDDGIVLTTDTATLDLHGGSAASADRTHVEGPFGTLDSQGFTITEQGQAAQFFGPGRLVLNGGGK